MGQALAVEQHLHGTLKKEKGETLLYNNKLVDDTHVSAFIWIHMKTYIVVI